MYEITKFKVGLGGTSTAVAITLPTVLHRCLVAILSASSRRFIVIVLELICRINVGSRLGCVSAKVVSTADESECSQGT